MKQWWSQLQKREQLLLLTCAGMLLIVICYWGVWQPWASYKQGLSKRLETQQQTLSWALANQNLLLGAQNPRQSGAINLNQLVSTTARANAISITRLQPKEQSLDLWIDAVRFEVLMLWLEELKRNHGVATLLLDVDEIEGRSAWVKVKRLTLGNTP